MSLNVDNYSRRGRSRSPGRRVDEREVSRNRVVERESSRVRAPSPPSSRRYNDVDDDRYAYEERTTTIRSSRDDRDREGPRYSKPEYRSHSPLPPSSRRGYDMPGEYEDVNVEEEVRVKRYGGRGGKEYYEEKRTVRRDEHSDHSSDEDDHHRRPRYNPDGRDREREYERYKQELIEQGKREYLKKEKVKITHDDRDHSPHSDHSSPTRYEKITEKKIITSAGHSRYGTPPKWEYAQPNEKITYTARKQYYDDRSTSYHPPVASARTSQTQVVTVEPGKRRSTNPDSLGPRMSSLTVATAVPAGSSLAMAPGSPLLEAYHGTYQSISPMPSPLMIAAAPHSSTTEIDVLDISSGGGSRRKRARFHDPADDAAALAKALRGTKSPDTGPLIEILPALTHEQVMDLRVEYKKIVKAGSDRKGVNIAKHIKMRLKDEDTLLMKACYATALGKWESEGYWANFWYQGEKSRRELLIESLMGRTNAEIRAIKDGFSDKKYSDSLTKCMKQELKEDKFKKAVLLVLEERRMEERPGYSLDRVLVEEDVRELHKAVRSEKGGETAMINIIVLRSDSHLREVLRVYEVSYRANFAREMLKKSGNLIGETLAHILNGIINRPVRDALLVNHALSLSKSDSLRTELLISRLVLYHWDRPHMEAVKREYRNRYGKELQVAVREGTKGEWGEFCEELCVTRIGDDVRRVERVEMTSTTSYRVG